MSRQAAARLAWAVCGLTLALIACALVLAFLNPSNVREVTSPLALTVSTVVGGLIASRRPANPVGWFFLGSAGCFALTGVAAEYATYRLPGAWAMAWLLSWLWVPGVMLLLCFLPLYFPNGRLVSPRWRWVVRFALFFSVTVPRSCTSHPTRCAITSRRSSTRSACVAGENSSVRSSPSNTIRVWRAAANWTPMGGSLEPQVSEHLS
jgi:hypothetical protein